MSVAILVCTCGWAASRACCFVQPVLSSLGRPLLKIGSWCMFAHHLCAARQNKCCSSFTHGVFACFMHGSPRQPLPRFCLWCVCHSHVLARKNGHCFGFAHGVFAPLFVCGSQGRALLRYLLMVCSSFFMHSSPRRALLWFCSKCCSFWQSLQCRPLLRFLLMVCFPLFVHRLAGTALLQSCSWCVCPFLRVAHWDVIAPVLLVVHSPFHARLAGTGIALILLMVWSSFCAQLARTAVALVSLMVCPPVVCSSLGRPSHQFHSWYWSLLCEASCDGCWLLSHS